MDQSPLVIEEIDAGTELVEKFGAYMPVKAAFWLKAADEDVWTLYIASDNINERTYDLGYGEVLRLAQEIRNPNLDPFRVRLIPGDDRQAIAAQDLNNRYPGRMGTRFQGKKFGEMFVDGVYVYPHPIKIS